MENLPSAMLFNFHLTAINTFSGAFSGIDVSGCFFHFSSNIWERIQVVGLQHSYNNIVGHPAPTQRCSYANCNARISAVVYDYSSRDHIRYVRRISLNVTSWVYCHVDFFFFFFFLFFLREVQPFSKKGKSFTTNIFVILLASLVDLILQVKKFYIICGYIFYFTSKHS